uniref:uncharacterized protein LOC118146671 n=1 Tax=Callithrix jacchus TaxID=9483 RepID=UPI0023DD5AD2|nr:uncharacterized protein LOC118146671 [Callithrix jacchus]
MLFCQRTPRRHWLLTLSQQGGAVSTGLKGWRRHKGRVCHGGGTEGNGCPCDQPPGFCYLTLSGGEANRLTGGSDASCRKVPTELWLAQATEPWREGWLGTAKRGTQLCGPACLPVSSRRRGRALNPQGWAGLKIGFQTNVRGCSQQAVWPRQQLSIWATPRGLPALSTAPPGTRWPLLLRVETRETRPQRLSWENTCQLMARTRPPPTPPAPPLLNFTPKFMSLLRAQDLGWHQLTVASHLYNLRFHPYSQRTRGCRTSNPGIHVDYPFLDCVIASKKDEDRELCSNWPSLILHLAWASPDASAQSHHCAPVG